MENEKLSPEAEKILNDINNRIQYNPKRFTEYGQYWFKLKDILQKRLHFPYSAEPDYTSFYPFQTWDENGRKIAEMSDNDFILEAEKFVEEGNHCTYNSYVRYWWDKNLGVCERSADLVDHNIGYGH